MGMGKRTSDIHWVGGWVDLSSCWHWILHRSVATTPTEPSWLHLNIVTDHYHYFFTPFCVVLRWNVYSWWKRFTSETNVNNVGRNGRLLSVLLIFALPTVGWELGSWSEASLCIFKGILTRIDISGEFSGIASIATLHRWKNKHDFLSLLKKKIL
jgi:hypothetical protein